jgi:hypothetical protein
MYVFRTEVTKDSSLSAKTFVRCPVQCHGYRARYVKKSTFRDFKLPITGTGVPCCTGASTASSVVLFKMTKCKCILNGFFTFIYLTLFNHNPQVILKLSTVFTQFYPPNWSNKCRRVNNVTDSIVAVSLPTN